MKKTILFALCMLMACLGALADTTTITLTVGTLPETPTVPTEPKPKPTKGERVPARPIPCIIDFDNATIDFCGNVETDDIVSFEAWESTEGGACLIATGDAASFVSALAQLHGEILVSFTTEDHILYGYLSL